MSAIFSAQLVERGGYYQVTNVYFKEIKFIIPEAKYVLLANEDALKLKNELNHGKFIKINKEFIDSHNPDSPCSIEQFKIVEPDSLQQKKAVEKARCNQRLAVSTAVLTAFEIFQFFVITSKMQTHGFNLFDDNNKEETYLNIINTGDEKLINELEKFLEIKDKFDRIVERHNFVNQYFTEIDDCDSEEELKEVIESNNGWLVS
jgi:hypothetical protein